MSPTPSHEIAAAAARLVVDEGMEYGVAKHKAARALLRRGARAAEMPANEQVEDAVRELIDVFHAATQPAELRALREVARAWMTRLAPFRPHLAGAVWRGTATARSAIQIDLYCDDPKGAEIELVNLGVDYDSGAITRPRAEPLPVLSVAARHPELRQAVTLHLLVRDLDEQRGALKPDTRGRSWRGDAAALDRLLAAQPGT